LAPLVLALHIVNAKRILFNIEFRLSQVGHIIKIIQLMNR